nr:proline racemase family protein [Sinirhodobacter populi]
MAHSAGSAPVRNRAGYAYSSKGALTRDAVLYGDKAIDRSPCGTGTSARIAQPAAQGQGQGQAEDRR